VQRVVLPAVARSGEHEEDLLLVGVHVQRHRPAARRDPVAAQADVTGAGRRAQAAALAAQVAVLERRPRHVVGVTDHRGAAARRPIHTK
jgi:hypothetical protein